MDEKLYPDNLFSAVASNILAKFNGVPGGATIQKEAAEEENQEYAKPIGYIPYTLDHGGDKWLGTSVLSGLGAGGILGGMAGRTLGKKAPGSFEFPTARGGLYGGAAGALSGGLLHALVIRPRLPKTKEDKYTTVFRDEDLDRVDPAIGLDYEGVSDVWDPEDIVTEVPPRGMRPTEKQAADQSPEATNQFLSQYHFTPAQFAGDRLANGIIAPQERAAMQKMRQAFDEQARMLGQTTPQLSHNRELSLQNIHRQAEDARIDLAIQRTMAAANDNPEQFGQMVDLSNRSQRALQKSKLDVLGTLGGGAAGAGLGALLGKSTGGRVATGLAGLAGGALAGREVGRRAEQNQTGYAYHDVLKPYQVADRMDKRQEADARK